MFIIFNVDIPKDEIPQERQEDRETIDSESSESKKLTTPMRKISRFLVSPVVEQKSVTTDGQTTVQLQVVEVPSVPTQQEGTGNIETGLSTESEKVPSADVNSSSVEPMVKNSTLFFF